jgi:hypothetical protein
LHRAIAAREFVMLGRMRATADQRGRRLRRAAPALAAIPLAVCAVALAAPSKAVVIADKTADVSGALDIQRASVNLAADGRLRAVVTFAAKVDPKDLLAKTGPPGSACLRIWTVAAADPAVSRPDHLVCVTADKDAKLRASVLEQGDAGLPRRTATAAVTENSSGRSFVMRMSQSALGRPSLIRFAVESTRPGCERTSCIDTAPDAGAVRRFRLK